MYNTNLLDAPANYLAGLYIRLSQEDKNKKYESDSESVSNQRNILMNFVKANGFTFVDEYVDDGYSGTNFERPSFKRMIEDIENKKINLVIVKDLSRLGRDHVNTGYYMERYFPENKVRFISIMESYDSAKNQASNDSSTFIVACNDYYSKQNSNKIRDVLHSKKKNGKFIGSKPCYGYMRDPEDKGHLIPNPETADTVRNIFKWKANGIGISEITTRLNDDNIPTPSGYKKTKLSSRCLNSSEWTISSVNKILKNRMYTGDMVQNVQTKINYKSEKKITLDQSLWIIVEDTHEPLVDKKTFWSIQNMPSSIPETRTERPKRLLENLLFCKECGNFLTVNYKKKIDYWSVNCNRYARDPKRRRCEPHFFPYNYLEEEIMRKIKKTVRGYLKSLNITELNDEVVNRTNKLNQETESVEMNLYKQKETIEKRIKHFCNSFADGLMTNDTLRMMLDPLEKELEKIKKEIRKKENKIINQRAEQKKIPDYSDKIKELLNIENPTRDLMFALIDRIEIDKEKNIEIKYKFNLIENDKFQYIGPQEPRNPYGPKGKKKSVAKD